MNSIRFLGVSLFAALLFSSCVSVPNSTIEPFPISPNFVDYDRDPIISYKKKDKTYIVSEEMVSNSALYKLFVEEILKWRKESGIR
jgi:hypothetical protein